MSIFLFLLYLLTLKTTIEKSIVCKPNLHVHLRNIGFRLIIFKEKKLPKICNRLKSTSQICHNKTIFFVSECCLKYNELSEEEKIIIESVIELLY